MAIKNPIIKSKHGGQGGDSNPSIWNAEEEGLMQVWG